MKNNFLYLFLVYFFGFLIFSIIYFVSFHTRLFYHEGILFYRGIKLLIVTFFLFLIILLFVKNRLLEVSWETFVALLILSTATHLVFFVIFPVTFERSLTMFLLNQLNENQGIKKEKLEKFLIDKYILKNHALEKRIKEQSAIGFFKVDDEKIFLTKKGKEFLHLTTLIKKIYGIDK